MCQWHAVVNAVESSQVHSALQSSIFIGCVHLFVTKTQILNQIIERFRPKRKTKTKSTNLHWTMNVHVLYWCRLFLHHVSAVFMVWVLKPLERVKVQIHFCCHDIVFFKQKISYVGLCSMEMYYHARAIQYDNISRLNVFFYIQPILFLPVENSSMHGK